MAWGARLISPTGLIASENATAKKNDRPISRHILFMTDGEMNPPRSNLSHQGLARSLPRIGATDESEDVARHTHRFPIGSTSCGERWCPDVVSSVGAGTNK